MRTLVDMIAALLLLAGCALAGPVAASGHPQADITARIAPSAGRLEGEMRLTLPDTEPLPLSLGPGFELTEAEIANGEVERVGQRGVVLRPATAGAATRRWSGAPPGSARSYIGDRGAWLGDQAGWYPHPTRGRLGYELTVALPERLQAVASGSRRRDRVRDGQRRLVFTHEGPSLGITLLAGDWDKRAQETEYGTVYTLFPETLAGQHDTYLERTAAYLETYSEWIGEPPHETYTVAAAPFPVGLGFAGFTALGERVLTLPFIPGTSLAHEVVHNWWGRGVYTAPEQGNWSEGLTLYMGDYHQAARRAADEARRMRGDWLRSEAALPDTADYPLEAFHSNAGPYDEIVGYKRGAFLFHTLHRALGDSGFDRAVHRFYRAYRHREAAWEDLAAAFTEAARAEGRDPERIAALLDWFRTETELPRLVFDERTLTVTEKPGGGYRVAADLSWDAAGYPVRVPVTLTTEAGTAAHRTVALEPGETTRVTLASEAPPRYLRADPDYHVYRELVPGEGAAILRDTLLAESVTLVSEWDGLAGPARQALAGRVEPGEADRERPLLIVGPRQAVARTLEAVRACGMQRIRPVATSPVAWASTTGGGRPLIALAAESPDQARQALRRLGRYGRHSYVAFGAGHETETGLYEPTDRNALRLPLADQLEGG